MRQAQQVLRVPKVLQVQLVRQVLPVLRDLQVLLAQATLFMQVAERKP